MRKISLLLFSIMLTTIGNAQKKVLDPNTKDSVDIRSLMPHKVTQIIKTNPLPILFGAVPPTSEYRLGIEIVTGQSQATQFSLSYLGKWVFMDAAQDPNNNNTFNLIITTSGGRIQLQHKFYLMNVLGGFLESPEYAPEGFYVSPHVSYSTVRFSTKYLNQYDAFIRGTHFNVNMLCGYQGIMLNSFAFDFFAGLGYKRNTWLEQRSPNNVQQIDPDEFPGIYNIPVKFTLGFNVGYGF